VSQSSLVTYLNDHLAGGTAALDLLDHLLDHPPPGQEAELRRLRSEIEEDKALLLRILEEAGGRESGIRAAAARLAEKLGHAKLLLDSPGGRAFRDFEALEALALGIQGKAALWRALAHVAETVPDLARLDFADLERRAQEQFQRADRLRLEAAGKALSS
jgi:hypothetical protein